MITLFINLSCVLNLAVIFMLISSLPVNESQNLQQTGNNSLNITAFEPDTSQKIDDFIQKLKTKYRNLDTIDFDRIFLNGTVVTFLNQCKINDLSCITYFDMLLGLAKSLPTDSLKSIKSDLWKNNVTCNSFCAEFAASLPDEPFSTETKISLKMKESTVCNIECLTLSGTAYVCDIKPICSITLSGYKQIISHSNRLNLSTLNVTSNLTDPSLIPVKRVSNDAVPIRPVPKSQKNAASPNKSEIQDASPTASNVTANISLHGVPNYSREIAQSPKNDHVQSTSNKLNELSNTKADTTLSNKSIALNESKQYNNYDNAKVKIKGTKTNKTGNITIATEKNGDNVALNGEITPGVNVPLFDLETTSVSPFISNDAFDNSLLNPPSENDDIVSEEYEDEDGQNPVDDVPSPGKSGETLLVNSNDILDVQKPSLKADAEYGKQTNTEENKEHPDEFTGDPDSYFFTYFMFIMVLCVMVYVIYHNKVKVLALVLEGRRGSHIGRGIGRRKHTAAYRKLDSNLEEAITSNSSGRTAEIIY